MKKPLRASNLVAEGALGLILALAGCRAPRPGKVLETPFPVVDQAGNAREYRLFLPDVKKGPLPLLVYFHGAISPCFKRIPSLKRYTGSPVEETDLIPFCRSRGIALLVPRAKYEYIHRNCTSVGWMIPKEIDGVEKIIDTVAARFDIDGRRIYLAGFCAGAVFSHFLANRRPRFYSAIVSHSQAYVSLELEVLKPAEKGPQFGIVFCYTRRDIKQLVRFCIESEKIYRGEGYRTALLPYLRPRRHAWSFTSDELIWNTLLQVGRK
jgi:hypothetical protein